MAKPSQAKQGAFIIIIGMSCLKTNKAAATLYLYIFVVQNVLSYLSQEVCYSFKMSLMYKEEV